MRFWTSSESKPEARVKDVNGKRIVYMHVAGAPVPVSASRKRKQRKYSRHPLYDTVLDRHDHKCAHCGSAEMVGIHHIDGIHEHHVETNMVPLCWECHMAVHNRKLQLNQTMPVPPDQP